jgi:NitT/TauT family transport system substrate-binding protein
MAMWFSKAQLRLLMVLTLLAPLPLHAEVVAIRIAHQPGLSYLPLMLIERHGLLPKHGRALGLSDLAYKSVLVGSAAALNDVLLSNSADIIAGAITVMAALSDRARHLDIRGIAALNCDAFYLNTNKPDIKTLRDFGSSDRIAVSAVKLSIHAIVLQMAAEKEFGPGRHTELDPLTVSMPHPEAMASLLAAGTEITAHITTTPFKKMELANPRIHRVLSSNTLVGGRATGAMVWTTGQFRAENPMAYAAFFNALKESIDIIRNDPDHAAQVYRKMENSKLDPVLIRAIVADPEDIFTIVPEHTFDFVDFMQRTGRLKGRFNGWKDLFFPEIHGQPGS